MAAKSQVMDIAAQANVTISALDMRGLYTEMEDVNKTLESLGLNEFMREDSRSSSLTLVAPCE
jgi:hypothetical protein